ncbi:death domain-associated protein 6-like [Salmo salar]|uniref:Death domain-associated protein 6-like n=1 Tax=Salmo salar TaxID=8030 RepID=A0A1S3LN59_SALSA|nr:death domain-associated protein 6-like [Salmo salar]|eukprot:XP_013991974.1 PREDICTED: death domain-associated protein 6-like [Salmo salar]
METRGRSTRAGVLFWTPAPQHPSPSTSIDSDVDWWDEDEEEGGDRKEEEEEDFHSQMDENGIIGLENALQNVGLGKEEEEGEEEGVENGEDDLPWYSGALDPEGPREGFLSSTRAGGIGLDQRLEQVDPLEELSYNLSDLQNSEPLSQSEPPGEDTHTLSFDVLEAKDSVEIWSEDEEQQQKYEEVQSWWSTGSGWSISQRETDSWT